jgi:XisI protein
VDVKTVEKIIEAIFTDLTPPNSKLGDLTYHWLMDKERQHYQLLLEGWDGTNRILEILVQIDIRGETIWIQEDNTDYGVAETLVKQGIPRNQIVLGFHAPYKRPYTEFATGE